MTNRRSAKSSMAWTSSSTSTVRLFSAVFNVKSFTKSWLTSGFMIAYVYLACLLILSLVRVTIRAAVDFVGWSNAFGLRNAIARERGIAAYRAWVPFERIRPADIPQEKWEEAFAWPANNKPPYPPLAQRMLRRLISYMAVVLIAAVLLQVFTPFPAPDLAWPADKNVGRLIRAPSQLAAATMQQSRRCAMPSATVASRRRQQSSRGARSYRRLVVGMACIGAFMGQVDSSIMRSSSHVSNPNLMRN